MKLKKLLCLILALITSLSLFAGCNDTPPEVENVYIPQKKNVILFIGDGMGPKHEEIASIYKGEDLAIWSMPHKVKADTSPYARDYVTDSAAAATALATGTLTWGGWVGMDVHENNLETIMDIAINKGKSTGVISTEVLTGATPSGFSAHSMDRNNSDELVATAVQSGINFFAGYKFDSSKYDDYVAQYVNNDYYVGTSFDDNGWMENDKVMFQLDIKPEQNATNDYVMFSEIIVNALDYLAQDPDGFVLMAEGAHIDKKSHANELLPMIKELLAFDLGVKVALDWAKNRDDTAIIVTADHETGGLSYDSSITKDNMFSTPALYSWGSGDHTGTNVNCYILGAEIDFSGFLEFKSSTKIKNTDIFKIMKGFVG